jgi:hypothetical protein
MPTSVFSTTRLNFKRDKKQERFDGKKKEVTFVTSMSDGHVAIRVHSKSIF